MRIAHIVPIANHTPWFADICAETARRGHDVVAIIHDGPGNLAERLTGIGIRHYRVPMHFGEDLDRMRALLYAVRLPAAALKIARILRRERIDVAHSHIFVSNMVTRTAKAFARFRHVAGAASPRHLEASFTRRLDRSMRGLDDAIVAGCDYIARLYDAPDVRTIYYGPPAERFNPSNADPAAFRRDLGIAADAPLVGIVAHFYPPMHGPQQPRAARGVGLKGHEHFIAAARIVLQRFPDARFVLVGSGPNARGEEYRQSLMESTRDEPRVFYAGHRYDIANVLASFDVAVQCSLTETLGGTIEALLMERPLVATAVGGMPESVRHEQTGLLVPPSDPPALAGAIERLLADRDEAQRLGRAGRALMLERFTLERTGADLSALYESLARVS
ncbi:MAG TPA: glycosyltransferase [Thermoanaerobaculia bacterium]|nr:glycosyltransferase [Thermoanaerobaculia bacterium]